MSDAREVTIESRLRCMAAVNLLMQLGYRESAERLLDQVRCCGEFPECSHVLAWADEVADGRA